jgi:hypothetical protein
MVVKKRNLSQKHMTTPRRLRTHQNKNLRPLRSRSQQSPSQNPPPSLLQSPNPKRRKASRCGSGRYAGMEARVPRPAVGHAHIMVAWITGS